MVTRRGLAPFRSARARHVRRGRCPPARRRFFLARAQVGDDRLNFYIDHHALPNRVEGGRHVPVDDGAQHPCDVGGQFRRSCRGAVEAARGLAPFGGGHVESASGGDRFAFRAFT